MTATTDQPIETSGQRPITRIVKEPPYIGMIDGRFLRPAEKVNELNEDILRDANAMAHALKHCYTNGFANGRRGLALAHPQVNMRPWAFFVVFSDIEKMERGDRVTVKSIFNPEIVGFEGRKRSQWEMCLSFPFHDKSKVERYERVIARWQELEKDENGNFKLSEKKQAVLEGKMAQVWQHEMEHMLGGNIYGAPMW